MGYSEFKSYEGKKGNYNMVNINCEKMDANVGPALKSEFNSYFNSDACNKESKYLLNLEKVTYIDSSGLSLILLLSRLDRQSRYKGVILWDPKGSVTKELMRTGIPNVVEYVQNFDEL